MMEFVCGRGGGYTGLPPAGDGFCCVDAIEIGPDACTCWVEQRTMDAQRPVASHDPVPRSSPCADCAFRPDSPERAGDERYSHADLDDIVHGSTPFYCHDGMQRVAALRHPAGNVHILDSDAYQPSIVDGVPYRADGSPAFICAGWRARHDAVMERNEAANRTVEAGVPVAVDSCGTCGGDPANLAVDEVMCPGCGREYLLDDPARRSM